MTDHQKQLGRELAAVGANSAELKKLLPIAARLGALKYNSQPYIGGRRKLVWARVLIPAAYTSLGLAAGMLLLIAAQVATPASWLFPVQRASDGIAMDMHPQYRAVVMMKRARQVNQLVSDHADTQQVLMTLADYTRVADVYKSMPHANYAAFEYCELNLREASVSATPNVQRAITASLQSLETS